MLPLLYLSAQVAPPLIIPGLEFLKREKLLCAGNRSHYANRATNHDAWNGSPPASGSSLVDARDPETVLQIIVGAWQAREIITVKQPRCEVLGEVAKMLKCLCKRPQRSKAIPHPRQVRQIPFPDALTRVLRLVGQDHFGLIQEAIGVLKWRPERRCGLQPFGQKLV